MGGISCKQGVSRTASGKIEIIHLQKVKFSEARIQVPRRQIVTLQRKGQLTGFRVKTGKMWQKTAICALLVSSVRGVSISKESSGPIIVQAGQELLIDCDFSFDKDEEEELVVKWFFNASTTPFYQWVPALDVGPQVISREAPGKIDLSYSVDKANSFTKHRTLRVPEASLAHSGAYTCQVSSFTHEASSTVDIAVYVPPSSLELTSTSSDDGNMIILNCVATGVFPAPSISLAWTESLVPQTGEMFSKSSENNEGLFTSSVSTTVARGLVGKEDLAKCTLEMPGFDIHMKKEVPLIEEEIPEAFLKMLENAEHEKEEAAMAWQEEKQAEANALQKQETPTVNDNDNDGKEGKGGNSEGGRSAAAGRSTFLFTNVVFSVLLYNIFC